MRSKLYILTLTIFAVMLSGCNDRTSTESDKTSHPIRVKTSTVASNTNVPFVTVSGKIQAANSSDLSTRVMGYVDNILVKIGDKVTKGQLLLSVNNADLSAKLAQVNAKMTEATAMYTNAEKDYKRFKNLFDNNSASQKEFDDMSANYSMARARLEAARQMQREVQAQFNYVNLRAPFEGVISNKFINVGDMAKPGAPLLEIEAPGVFQVTAMVPESEILQVTNNTTVEVTVKALEKTITGKVTEVSTSSKNTGGQYLVKVLLDNTDLPILSGMFSTVKFPISSSEQQNIILIPRSAIISRGELSGVYTVSQSDTALLRWLRLGRTYGANVEVLSGLNAGEHYIISSEGKLFNGVEVTIQ